MLFLQAYDAALAICCDRIAWTTDCSLESRDNQSHCDAAEVKQTVTVRSFERKDLPNVLRIERESFDRDAWSWKDFLDCAGAAQNLFLVASVAGRIAGYSLASVSGRGAEIDSVGVLPRYRQKGVATVLLKTTIRKVRRAGAHAVRLMVRRENKEAIGLYRKLGFVRVRTIPNYYDNDSSGWRMRIILNKECDPSSPRRASRAR